MNAVREGDYVLVFTIGSMNYSTWPASARDALVALGIKPETLAALQDGDPVIFLGTKGATPGSALEILPDKAGGIPPAAQRLALEETISGRPSAGTLVSPEIGPALSWGMFDFEVGYAENPTTDQYGFDLMGLDENYESHVLFANVKEKRLDLTSVNAVAYPRLKLRMNTSDEDNFTPTQLHRWTVTYQTPPEGVLYIDNAPQQPQELQEGDTLRLRYQFENISNTAFNDSIAVRIAVHNQDQRKTHIDTIRLAPLPAGTSAGFPYDVPTMGRAGANNILAFANPYIQPEQTYNNNRVDLIDYLNVLADQTNPLLEVTFDGQFIMNGDIVSPTPAINLRVKDDNTILLKKDTADVQLFLKRPCEGCDYERISFCSPQVVWHPATETSDFYLEYRPEALTDGIYTLRAQASDASGNEAGSQPYSVQFEVVNESQITNFYPYPNPFSTSTRFVFTLTGSVIPQHLIIQIMTVSGRVVREITQDEIGPIRIGHNITEYAWDGRDEFGDRLANGVYLYRVKMQHSGEPFKMRATAGDKAFKNGFGKVYLLR
jgi:hypothetical protein